jgi:hypothetical protein
LTSTAVDKNVQGLSSDDIIELNIGGQKMTTLRSTLTAIPNSKLALMFSKNNTKNMLSTDKQGAIFFDYNPIYFNYLLDQLRTIKRMPRKFGYQLELSSPPFTNTQVNFTEMLTDLGLTRKLRLCIPFLHLTIYLFCSRPVLIAYGRYTY